MSLSGRATGRALLPDKRIGSAQIDLIQDDPHVDATHRRRRHAHRQSRQVVFDTVHALNEEGLSCSEIAHRTGYGRRSIAKMADFRDATRPTEGGVEADIPLIFRGVPRGVLERWQSLRTASFPRYQTARLHGQLLESRAASRNLAPPGEIGQGQRVARSDHLVSTGPRCCPDTRSVDRP